MKLKLIVSFLLLTACFTAFGQKKQDMAVVEKGLIKVSIMHPYADYTNISPVILVIEVVK